MFEAATDRADVPNEVTHGASHQLFLEAQSLQAPGQAANQSVEEPDELTMAPIAGYSDAQSNGPSRTDTISTLMENPPTEPIPRVISTHFAKTGQLKVDCKPEPKGFEGPRVSDRLRILLEGVQG